MQSGAFPGHILPILFNENFMWFGVFFFLLNWIQHTDNIEHKNYFKFDVPSLCTSLRGSGGMLPRKILKSRLKSVQSGGILGVFTLFNKKNATFTCLFCGDLLFSFAYVHHCGRRREGGPGGLPLENVKILVEICAIWRDFCCICAFFLNKNAT